MYGNAADSDVSRYMTPAHRNKLVADRQEKSAGKFSASGNSWFLVGPCLYGHG